MKMKLTTKLLGILIASIALVACGGGGSVLLLKPRRFGSWWKYHGGQGLLG